MSAATIACVLKGGGPEFGPDYVEVLWRGLHREMRCPWRLVCLTDQRLPERPGLGAVPLTGGWPGRWSKLELFRPDLEPLRPFLFLDLDSAIVGDLAGVWQLLERVGKWTMLRDLHRPVRAASGAMFLPACHDWSPVWEHWARFARQIIEGDPGADDGAYIAQRLPPEASFQEQLPGRFVSFKPLDAQGHPRPIERVPDEAAVVCFHGQPRPRDEAAKQNGVRWVRNYWTGDETRPSPLSDYPRRHTGTLIVLGSAAGGLEEFARVRAARPDAEVGTVGHAAALVPAQFLFTDHYEMHEKLRALQAPYNTAFTTHCARSSGWEKWKRWVDFWWDWPRAQATSAQSAIRVGLAVGFREIILCGCPIEAGRIQHPDQREKDGNAWPPPNKFLRRSGQKELEDFRLFFVRFARECNWRGRVFSMSGFTRETLGEPKL